MFVASAAGLGTDCMEELQIEMKVAKRDFEEKLLDARGGKEMLDLGKQQMTAEKQKLASEVSHLSEEVHLGLMSWGCSTAGQRLFSSKSSVPFWGEVTLEGGETMRGSPGQRIGGCPQEALSHFC